MDTRTALEEAGQLVRNLQCFAADALHLTSRAVVELRNRQWQWRPKELQQFFEAAILTQDTEVTAKALASSATCFHKGGSAPGGWHAAVMS